MNSSRSFIKASIRSADIGNLAIEIEKLEEAGIDAIHFDVMDGHFGPQEISMGPMFLRGLRKYTDLPFEVHLWVRHPEQSLDRYVDAGADCILFHIEACSDPGSALQKITRSGCAAGLCINPSTDPNTLTGYFEACTLVNVMTIDPQQAGEVNYDGVNNLRQVSEHAANQYKDLIVQADGAVSAKTRNLFIESGASSLVAGYPIFSSSDYKKTVAEMRGLHSNQMDEGS